MPREDEENDKNPARRELPRDYAESPTQKTQQTKGDRGVDTNDRNDNRIDRRDKPDTRPPGVKFNDRTYERSPRASSSYRNYNSDRDR